MKSWTNVLEAGQSLASLTECGVERKQRKGTKSRKGKGRKTKVFGKKTKQAISDLLAPKDDSIEVTDAEWERREQAREASKYLGPKIPYISP
jgi:hypothetical protein